MLALESVKLPSLATLRVDDRLIVAGLFIIAMFPMMVTPVLPLIDFYNHLSRFYVLAHIGSNPLLQNDYEPAWGLLPDVVPDAIASLLLRFVPPLAGGHIIVAGTLAILYSGVLYLHRVLTGQRSLFVAIAMLPLLYSYILNWGFINFIFGLGLAFWGAGWWISNRHRPKVAVPISSLFSVLIFLCHGVAFALYGVLVICLEVGIYLKNPERRLRSLVGNLGLLTIQAVIPFLLFFLWQNEVAGISASSRLGYSPLAFSSGWTIKPGHTGFRRLSTIVRVEEGPAFWFDVATLAVQLSIAFFLFRRKRLGLYPAGEVLVVVAFALIVLVPQKMFGVDYIADRMPLFAGCCLLSMIFFRRGISGVPEKIALTLLIGVVFLRLGAIAADWSQYRAMYAEFREIASEIPKASLTVGVGVGAGRHETEIPRCEMFPPLLITEFDQIGPSFFNVGQHPLHFKGRLGKAIDVLGNHPITANEDIRDYNLYMQVAATSGVDYLLLCNRQLLTQSVPSQFTIKKQSRHFILLRRV